MISENKNIQKSIDLPLGVFRYITTISVVLLIVTGCDNKFNSLSAIDKSELDKDIAKSELAHNDDNLNKISTETIILEFNIVRDDSGHIVLHIFEKNEHSLSIFEPDSENNIERIDSPVGDWSKQVSSMEVNGKLTEGGFKGIRFLSDGSFKIYYYYISEEGSRTITLSTPGRWEYIDGIGQLSFKSNMTK